MRTVTLGVCLLSAVAATQSPQVFTKKGVVDSPEVARTIALAILESKYGKENIRGQQPFSVRKAGKDWHVTGTLPDGYRGGVAEIKIQASDCRVTLIRHGK
jgi:hypothetical protein